VIVWEFSQFFQTLDKIINIHKDEPKAKAVCLNTNFNAMITRLIKVPALVLLLVTVMTAACQSQSAQEEGFQDLTVSEFKAKMAEDGVVVLDVRTPRETAEGMIEGAQEIDFRAADFDEQISTLDKNATYLVYCHSGGRSSSACTMMKDMGFEHVYNLVGGYQRWK